MARRRLVLLLVAGFLVGIATLSCTQAGRARTRATLLVLDLVAPGLPSPLDFPPRALVREEITVPSGAEPLRVLILRPAGNKPKPAVTFVLGYPSNIGDGEMLRVAERLAQLGYFVAIPKLPALAGGYLHETDVDALVDVMSWVLNHPMVDDRQVGMAGFCVGSSLALLAASDDRISRHIAAVNVSGGYADLAQYIRAIAAGSARYNGVEYAWQPAKDTVTLFVRNVTTLVEDPAELALISQALNQTSEQSTLPAKTSSNGHSVLALLRATGPLEADVALASLSGESNRWLKEMSPLNQLDILSAKVFIMHDPGDPYVPAIEASRLWDVLKNEPGNTYTKLELFDHVRPTRNLDTFSLIRDAIALTNHLSQFFLELEVNS